MTDLLDEWASVRFGRAVNRFGRSVALVRRGRGMVQVAAFESVAAALAALAGDAIAWVDVSIPRPAGARVWGGCAKPKDRAAAEAFRERERERKVAAYNAALRERACV